MIRVNQYSINNREVAYTENWSVWTVEDNETGDTYAALFNTGNEPLLPHTDLVEAAKETHKRLFDLHSGRIPPVSRQAAKQ